MLYLSFQQGSAPLGACIWPAVFSALICAFGVALSIRDVIALRRVVCMGCYKKLKSWSDPLRH
jgi:hypothetical protein